jgi:hypothetical protein
MRTRRIMNRAHQFVGKFGEQLKQQYGFLADPNKPLWYNVETYIGEMNMAEYLARPRNMACHNLLEKESLPVGTNLLLGLGLNYCIESSTATQTTTKTFDRLNNDIRRIHAFKLKPPEDSGYIPSLYIKSGYEFDDATDDIEEALAGFKQAVQAKQLQYSRQRKQRRNITAGRWNLLQYLRRNDIYIVIHGDKNLGPCILGRHLYIYRGCLEHLGNRRNYKQLSENEAKGHLKMLTYRMERWIRKWSDEVELLTDPEVTFLRRSKEQNPDRFARFRMTAKVHKTPWKMRPIVCCAGTFMNDWSKWLDYWLQKLKHIVPTYVKDSQQVLNELKLLDLPPHALLFTCDANAMYNNICTKHAIEVITWWLNDLAAKKQLPQHFPLEAVLSGMVMIMENNIFEFGNMYFLQKLGTAMGTSAAVMWATLYYAYHEVHTLIPKHGASLFYFKRFIDDILGVWIGNTTNEWKEFKDDVNDFGVLTWDIEDQLLSTSVDFLDLTLTIEGNKIVSKTFQKAMNLYLYLPSASAHPAGCIKGTIYGLINRYYAQNTYRRDYIYFVGLLYHRLLQRGWERVYIRGLMLEATTKIEARGYPNQQSPTPTLSRDDEDRVFIHLQYHPRDISRGDIQQLYEKHCGPLFRQELGVGKPTIAYSRPLNIGDYITQAKLHQAPGETASKIMGEHDQGLSP